MLVDKAFGHLYLPATPG